MNIRGIVTSAMLLLAACLCGSALAADSPDQAQIRQLLMKTFDKPESRLQIEPIVVQAEFALAGWVQGERGGRALLRRHGQAWRVHVCGGDGLKDPALLADAGLKPVAAKALVKAVNDAEARLPAAQRAKLSTFDGLLRMDAQGHHPH